MGNERNDHERSGCAQARVGSKEARGQRVERRDDGCVEVAEEWDV